MMMRWLIFAGFLTMSCRGKDNHGAPIASGVASSSGAGGSEQARVWAAVIREDFEPGESIGVQALASGPLGTFIVTTRQAGSAIAVNGKEVIASSGDEGNSVIQFDAMGKPIWSTTVSGQRIVDSVAVGSSDAVVGIRAVTAAAKGALVTLPSKELTPVNGNVATIARTASGTIWSAGRNWGSDDPLSEGRCDGDAFLARTTANGVEAVDCEFWWSVMHLAAVGEDVVMCAYALGGGKIGGRALEGKLFLARIRNDGTLAWVRYIAEVGDAVCDDIVITSDGDIVASGVANKNVDFSEGAKARGVPVKSSGGSGLDRLWLARFGADGTRRWVRPISTGVVGFSSDLDRDREGNVVLVSTVNSPLDLGDGPVGPDRNTIVATITLEGHVTGMLATDPVLQYRVAVDDQHGLVFVFETDDPIRVAGVAFEPPVRGVEYVGVVRIPLPLPPPLPTP
jgi:voltage-gated potassium channel Kch